MSPPALSCLWCPSPQAFPVPAAALLAVVQNGAKCAHCVRGRAVGTGYCRSPHALLLGVLVCGMFGFVALLGASVLTGVTGTSCSTRLEH